MNILYVIAGIILSVPALFIAFCIYTEIVDFFEEREELTKGLAQIMFGSAFVAIFIKIMSL